MPSINPNDETLDELMNFIDDPAEQEEQEEQRQQSADSLEREALGEDPAPAEPAPTQPATQRDPELEALRESTRNLVDLETRRQQQEAIRRQAEEEAAHQRQQEQTQQRRQSVYDDADVELTAEERATYEQSEGVIQKMVRRGINEYHRNHVSKLEEENERLRNEFGRTSQDIRVNADQALNATIRAAVPDLDTFTQSAEWQEYLAQPMPEFGAGVTRGNLLRMQAQNYNADAIIHIVRGFKASGNTEAKAPASGTPNPPVTPGNSGNGAPASQAAAHRTGSDKKLPYSFFAKKADEAEKGKFDPVKFQELTDLYLEKESQGLVDFNA